MTNIKRSINTKIPASVLSKLLTIPASNINTLLVTEDRISELTELNVVSHYMHPAYIEHSVLVSSKDLDIELLYFLLCDEEIKIHGKYLRFFTKIQATGNIKVINKYWTISLKNKMTIISKAYFEILAIAVELKATMNSKNHVAVLYEFIVILLKSNLFKLTNVPLFSLFKKFFHVSQKILKLIFFMNKLESIAIAKSIDVGVSGTSDVLSVKKYINQIKNYVDVSYIANIIKFIDKLAVEYKIDWDTTILNHRISKMCLIDDMPMLDIYVDDISNKLKMLYNANTIKQSGLYSALSKLEKGLRKYKASDGKGTPSWLSMMSKSYYIPTIVKGINYLFKHYYLNQLSYQSIDLLKEFLDNLLKNLDKVYI